MDNTARGTDAEQRALRYLQAGGLTLLHCNYRGLRGEIDLIMRDGDCTVFVEVRFRGGRRYGAAAETVDRRKQDRLIACAQQYLQSSPGSAERACRFDVVAFDGADGEPQWIRNAFTLPG